MLADTDAIRGFARAGGAHCADLSDVATALAAVPIGAADALGPVGVRFAAALAEAIAEHAAHATRLAERAGAGAGAAHRCATAYDDAGDRATALIRA
jgi:hypothetical protein